MLINNYISMVTYKIVVIILSIMLTACTGMFDRLENVGSPPPMNETANPTEKPDYKPISWPTPKPIVESQNNHNSLWRSGARTFFKDYRASKVGDILRVLIEIDDRAELENTTTRTRTSNETLATPQIFGMQDDLYRWLPGEADATSLLDISGSNRNEGEGEIDREEKIETEIAAIVTQILPNGNMVIRGSQEVRVNFEVREILLTGVVRAEDINSDNTVELSRIAEARVSYGGRGQISDVQQPRYGSQVIDIISPF